MYFDHVFPLLQFFLDFPHFLFLFFLFFLNMESFTNLRVILVQGHTNLCIVPVLLYVLPKQALSYFFTTASCSFSFSLPNIKWKSKQTKTKQTKKKKSHKETLTFLLC